MQRHLEKASWPMKDHKSASPTTLEMCLSAACRASLQIVTATTWTASTVQPQQEAACGILSEVSA